MAGLEIHVSARQEYVLGEAINDTAIKGAYISLLRQIDRRVSMVLSYNPVDDAK